ncbi:sugar phosphate permease [Jatrophihabitans sp. GAS493]|uniref:MFS transporter n=1 Tax=Jatrophihabitans sp. GAS493 TaxID=1907575 RepID=UPI000BC086F0|nr:MFS transporter [Jatrophihabitans sp. GAS493]SOD71289.1 sugar phosphate permease [Jatrophihabitans sp. GAS493]
MRSNRGHVAVLLIGSSLASGGWGAVLPFIYSDISTTRHLGGMVAAATFIAFAVGSLLAAPSAGAAADRGNPVRVAALARLVMALAVLALGLSTSTLGVWYSAAALGAGVAFTQPSISVLLLASTPQRRHRDVFAWQFITQNLTLAVGGFVGGLIIDLNSPAGTHRVYYLAALAAVASAVTVYSAGRGISTTRVPSKKAVEAPVRYREMLANRSLRLLLGVTMLITLACYAQYESGLPAFAINALHVSTKVIGTAVAVNAILVAILTGPVVALTKRYAPTTLLAACASIWIGCWLIIAVPLVLHGMASVALITGLATISVGETMLAPVLNPLAASIAPDGAVGRTLSAVSGATTLACAIGPALSGVLIAAGVPAGFIVLQLACCIGAIVLARRLGAHMRMVKQVADAETEAYGLAG